MSHPTHASPLVPHLQLHLPRCPAPWRTPAPVSFAYLPIVAGAAPRDDATDAPCLRLRHHARDHSVFVDGTYLIRGVAGAILAKVVRDFIATGHDHFTTRALRLAGDALCLPDVQDNLGVRLLMLQRRLDERDLGLRIERVGRGRYRLRARGQLRIDGGEAEAAPRQMQRPPSTSMHTPVIIVASSLHR
jgi:hypothetical protein